MDLQNLFLAFCLPNYILPTEDLDYFRLIKQNINILETEIWAMFLTFLFRLE